MRAAAGLVQEVGIIQPYLMSSFLEQYGKYIRAEDFSKPFTQTEHWSKFTAKSPTPLITAAKDIVIQIIGVWDTVGSLGVPDLGHWLKKDNSGWRKAYQFYNTDLSASKYSPSFCEDARLPNLSQMFCTPIKRSLWTSDVRHSPPACGVSRRATKPPSWSNAGSPALTSTSVAATQRTLATKTLKATGSSSRVLPTHGCSTESAPILQ